jgi:uncharacterized protein YndB with AHSA1/START domain
MNDTIGETEGISAAKLGSVGTLEDGRKFVLFERHLSYSIEEAWGAISDPDRLADWFSGFKLECRVGGRFEIWFSEQCEGSAHVTGTVTQCEPPNVLECGFYVLS